MNNNSIEDRNRYTPYLILWSMLCGFFMGLTIFCEIDFIRPFYLFASLYCTFIWSYTLDRFRKEELNLMRDNNDK